MADPNPFDTLTVDGRLSAIYAQVLDLHVKLSDVLARIAELERNVKPASPPEGV